MFAENSGTVSKVTTNQVGAAYQFNSWLKNNNYHSLTDASGTNWFLQVSSHLGPNPEDTQGGLWQIRILLSTELDRQNLLEAGVCDEKADTRLLKLLGDRHVPLEMNRPPFQCRTVEDARRYLIQEVEVIRQQLKSPRLSEIKRQYLGQWIDNHQLFR
ncbi:hypothetical protein [Pseudobacteriovorax antillogorgiicola]|uniref:Uncharacterized protein n=1 Tax=Pseudobacteriovorax antillogorgiicola TaxID=1513793 RepID=A0A1Y6CHZ5_9BACT|nr:hypothetical protein [Pseudobacteriovorax antillogorgiicola]TCS48618.1 hypothetical protein EDD56_11740 [Pseudobacteriovorax antillogorgiicola]SMF55456.1 hypothetical protein SAMN06296036_117119 [Pseudobacteriovorax antillogorgiicola]